MSRLRLVKRAPYTAPAIESSRPVNVSALEVSAAAYREWARLELDALEGVVADGVNTLRARLRPLLEAPLSRGTRAEVAELSRCVERFNCDAGALLLLAQRRLEDSES